MNICTPHPIIYSGDQIKKNAAGEDVAHVGEERRIKAIVGENSVKWTIKIDRQEVGWKRLGCIFLFRVYKNSMNFLSR